MSLSDSKAQDIIEKKILTDNEAQALVAEMSKILTYCIDAGKEYPNPVSPELKSFYARVVDCLFKKEFDLSAFKVLFETSDIECKLILEKRMKSEPTATANFVADMFAIYERAKYAKWLAEHKKDKNDEIKHLLSLAKKIQTCMNKKEGIYIDLQQNNLWKTAKQNIEAYLQSIKSVPAEESYNPNYQRFPIGRKHTKDSLHIFFMRLLFMWNYQNTENLEVAYNEIAVFTNAIYKTTYHYDSVRKNVEKIRQEARKFPVSQGLFLTIRPD